MWASLLFGPSVAVLLFGLFAWTRRRDRAAR
jgi:hypothetical protein